MADGYRVVSQRQTTELTADGRFGDVMEITFRTDGGTVGSVRIPLDRYSAQSARDAIDEYVTHIAAVESL